LPNVKEEHNNFLSSLHIIRMMRSVKHVAQRTCEGYEIYTKCLSGNLKGTNNFEDLGTDGGIMFKLILKKCGLK
jgi:hypothetical protein